MIKTGEFNLNFLGATIICDSIEKRNAIIEYLNGESPNFDIEVPFDDFQKTIDNIIYNTTYTHESRHLHDYLTSPLLVSILFQRAMMLTISTMMIEAWKLEGQRYKYLPLPLNKWIGLPIDIKHDLLSKKGISTEDVPMFDISSESGLSSSDIERYSLFDQYLLLLSSSRKLDEEGLQSCLDSYNTDYSIRSFIESLAFVFQTADILVKYGNKGIPVIDYIRNESFKNFMTLGARKRQGNNISKSEYLGYANYTSMFTYVYRYAYRNNVNPEVLYPFISHILIWGLCGDPSTNTVEGVAPRNRLECLFNLDRLGYNIKLDDDRNIDLIFKSPLEAFNIWDNTIHKAYVEYPTEIRIIQNGEFYPLSVISGAIDFEQFYIRITNHGKKLSLDLKEMGYNSLSVYIYNIFKAVAYMADNILNSAAYYLNPSFYVENMHRLVNVPVRFKFVNGIEITKDEIRDSSDIIIRDNMIYKDALNKDMIEVNKIIKCGDYLDAKKHIDFFDALTGACIVERPGALIKEMLPGIRPWFINV